MIPAATKTPGAQLPVASCRIPLTTGLATAPISEIRLSIPNAEPRSVGGHHVAGHALDDGLQGVEEQPAR